MNNTTSVKGAHTSSDYRDDHQAKREVCVRVTRAGVSKACLTSVSDLRARRHTFNLFDNENEVQRRRKLIVSVNGIDITFDTASSRSLL